MKQLFWKEWMPLRKIPLMCAAIVALFVVVLKIAAMTFHDKNADSGLPIVLTICLTPLAALVVGAGLFASEVADGTLMFLTHFPVSRGRIWLTKVLAGWAVITLSGIGMLITGTVAAAVLGAKIDMHLKPHDVTLISVCNGLAASIAPALWCFAFSLMISALTNSATTSFIVSIVAFAGFWIAALLLPGIGMSSAGGLDIYLVPTVAFFMTSYQTFTRGGSLQTARRFYVAGGVLGCWAAVGAVAVVVKLLGY